MNKQLKIKFSKDKPETVHFRKYLKSVDIYQPIQFYNFSVPSQQLLKKYKIIEVCDLKELLKNPPSELSKEQIEKLKEIKRESLKN
tara:strand:- start:302 stop:559 length:258 start_codon:yes stop_codon:yes gene_type:complete